MSWGAVAVAGAAIVSSAVQSRSAKKAGQSAASSNRQAIDEQREARLAFERRTEPFRQLGLAAAPSILQLLGIQIPEGLTGSSSTAASQVSSSPVQQEILRVQEQIARLQADLVFNPRNDRGIASINSGREQEISQLQAELEQLQQQALEAPDEAVAPAGEPTQAQTVPPGDSDSLLAQINPLVSFLRDEGFSDIQESAAAQGRLRSGGTLEDLSRFNTNLAATVVPQLQQQRFNQLFNLLGLGQNAAVGQGSAALSTASNIGNLMQGIGQAQGQAQIAQGQAIGQGINDLAGIYGLSRTGYFNQNQQPLTNSTNFGAGGGGNVGNTAGGSRVGTAI